MVLQKLPNVKVFVTFTDLANVRGYFQKIESLLSSFTSVKKETGQCSEAYLNALLLHLC